MKEDKIKYPKLPPELNRAVKLLPNDILAIKKALPVLYGRMPKNKARDLLAKKYGVSRYAIIYNTVWTDEQKQKKFQRVYEWQKKSENYNTDKQKAYRARYAIEKRARQKDEIRNYCRPYSRDYRKKTDNQWRRENSIEDAIAIFKVDGIKAFNKYYQKRPDFIKKVVKYEPLLVLFMDKDGTRINIA
jgi:hypothetical protein